MSRPSAVTGCNVVDQSQDLAQTTTLGLLDLRCSFFQCSCAVVPANMYSSSHNHSLTCETNIHKTCRPQVPSYTCTETFKTCRLHVPSYTCTEPYKTCCLHVPSYTCTETYKTCCLHVPSYTCTETYKTCSLHVPTYCLRIV